MPDQQHQREVAVRIIEATQPEHLAALEKWAQAMVEINSRPVSRLEKLKAALRSSSDREILAPILKVVWSETKRIGWDERGLAARMALGSATLALTLSGQNAGIAALGTAVGVPLFVVFGAGGALAGVIMEELRKSRSK